MKISVGSDDAMHVPGAGGGEPRRLARHCLSAAIRMMMRTWRSYGGWRRAIEGRQAGGDEVDS